MNTRAASQARKPYTPVQKNPLEAFNDLGRNTLKSSVKSFSDLGANMGNTLLDQFFGYKQSEQGHEAEISAENKPQIPHRRTEYHTLFDSNKDQEMRTIRELTQQIKQEIEALKKANSALINEVKDVENIMINAPVKQEGIYHIRFLEVVLSLLRTLKSKITESSTWLDAMTSKRKKRGSAFASLSKKKGTQYSLSQELSLTRSVQ